jgi:hypothetical protein
MGTVLITPGAARAAIPAEVKRKVKPIGPCKQHFQPSNAALRAARPMILIGSSTRKKIKYVK